MENATRLHCRPSVGAPAPNPKRRSSTRCRAASTLACALCGFVLIQALTSAVVDSIVPDLRDSEYSRKIAYLQARRRESPGRPLLIFLGSSRTAYGVAADEALTDRDAPLAYNFGILAGGPIYEMLYFHRLLAEGIRPQWLVLEIHPGFLHVAANLMLAHRPAIERRDFSDMCAIHGYVDHPWRDWLAWLRYRAAFSFQLRAELMRRIAPHWASAPATPDWTALDKTTPSGWVPAPGPRPDAALRKQRAQWGCEAFGASYRDFEVSDRTNRALRDILETCRRERIEVSLLLMPESAEMRDASATLAQREVRRYLAALSDEYGAPIIDATDWCASEDFADGQHLLPEAGPRLARRLGREVLADWIATAPPAGQPSQTQLIAGRPRETKQR